MKLNIHNAIPFGELVVAFFDEAAGYSQDPKEVSRLVMLALKNRMSRTLETSSPWSPILCTRSNSCSVGDLRARKRIST